MATLGRRSQIAKMTVSVDGQAGMRRKLRDPDNALLAEPWQELMEALGKVAQHTAEGAAPIGPSGRTTAMMFHKVQARPVPLWVRVGTHARARSTKYPRGYPYPRRINYDPKSPHKGWLDKAMARARSLVGPLLSKAARRIEGKWAT